MICTNAVMRCRSEASMQGTHYERNEMEKIKQKKIKPDLSASSVVPEPIWRYPS